MQNITVHLGSATPPSSRAGPRETALSTAPADSPAPPVSGTAARHCAAAHPSPPSLPARVRAPRSGRCRAMTAGRGQAPRHPRGACHPHAQDPHLFPSSFPFAALPPSRSLPSRAAPLALPSPLLSDPSSRAPEFPHRSPHPDRRLRPPAAPSPSWIPAEHCRRPPLPGELIPELPIPKISCKSLTPSPLPSCRTSSPPSATTGAPSPPTNAAARRRLHRLTIDSSFRCAPVLSSLSGTFPVTPSRSPATPCRHRDTVEPPVSTPPRRLARGACARNRPRRPVAPLGWAARPWPSQRFDRPRVAGRRVSWALASGRFRPGTVPGILNVFPIVLNHKN
jgi:hypothetical protein